MDIILSQAEIDDIVCRMGIEINAFYRETKESDPVLVVGVLNGAFIFMADLIRKFQFPVEVDFIQISSYGTSTVSSRSVQLVKYPQVSPAGRHVLIVEDIIDSGYSLAFLREWYIKRGANVAIAVLLDKYSRREIEVPCEFIGSQVANRFLAGYGLDGGGIQRQLPYIAAVIEEDV